ncbi:retrovirus-related pol polyprotein from transposon TNT 1-94, partial [Tanacetum coccineum]
MTGEKMEDVHIIEKILRWKMNKLCKSLKEPIKEEEVEAEVSFQEEGEDVDKDVVEVNEINRYYKKKRRDVVNVLVDVYGKLHMKFVVSRSGKLQCAVGDSMVVGCPFSMELRSFPSSRIGKQQCFSSLTTDQANLWHRRYGHLSWNSLNVLQRKNMVKGLPSFTLSQKVCEDCLVGKQHRSPFPSKSTWRASSILQLVHADLCGPITPISNSKKRYVITFTDDFSRKTWIYFLAEKSEAFATFKFYKVKVEKETGAFVRALRTDRGGEFTSLEFKSFCNENGIQRQLTAAYTPQQNGVAERKNRTIMNMVRSVLSAKQIPKTFWPEAVNWAVHVLNRSPTLALKDKTPEEAWSGIKPSVKYFRVFGCIGHVHVPDAKRIKLDSKSLKCIFFGVSDESKAYRLFDPVSNKILVSRDVVFEEDQQWNWDYSHKEAIQVDLEWENDEESSVESNQEEQ